jgi:hypothetical protein
MPRNSSGSYSLPSGNPVVSGTTITAAVQNSTMSDVATEMSDSLSRSGKGAMTAPLQVPNGTSAAPAVTFSSETASGRYRAGAGDIRDAVGGTDVWKEQAAGLTALVPLTASSTFTTSASGVTFSDATTQTTSASTQSDKSGITNGANTTAGSTVTRTGAGWVEAVLSFTATGAIAKGDTIGTLTNAAGRPKHAWYGGIYKQHTGVDGAMIPIGIGTDGIIVCYAAVSSGDTLFVTAVYLGA